MVGAAWLALTPWLFGADHAAFAATAVTAAAIIAAMTLWTLAGAHPATPHWVTVAAAGGAFFAPWVFGLTAGAVAWSTWAGALVVLGFGFAAMPSQAPAPARSPGGGVGRQRVTG